MKVSLYDAIQGCMSSNPGKVWVEFTFENDAETRIRQKQVSLSTLYKDWYNECNLCPPNEAKITDVCLCSDGNQHKFEVVDEQLEFGDFMDELERSWKLRPEKEE
jgi:hypothetical protein